MNKIHELILSVFKNHDAEALGVQYDPLKRCLNIRYKYIKPNTTENLVTWNYHDLIYYGTNNNQWKRSQPNWPIADTYQMITVAEFTDCPTYSKDWANIDLTNIIKELE